MEECVNCGSMSLGVVEATPGDIRNAAAPLGLGARKWQREMLLAP